MKNDATDFPRFPVTPYLGHPPSMTTSDVSANLDEYTAAKAKAVNVIIEEKLDGANVRIRFDGKNEPVVGNRDHVLKKGYLKDTPSKLQFRPLWTWVYDHRQRFKDLAAALGTTPVLYGEWLFARHTIAYDSLPELLIPFDLFFDGAFLDPLKTRTALRMAGFKLPPLVETGGSSTAPHLEGLRVPGAGGTQLMAARVSAWSLEAREGDVIKIGDGEKLTARFKVVRHDFKPRDDFTTSPLEHNHVAPPKRAGP